MRSKELCKQVNEAMWKNLPLKDCSIMAKTIITILLFYLTFLKQQLKNIMLMRTFVIMRSVKIFSREETTVSSYTKPLNSQEAVDYYFYAAECVPIS